MFANTPDDTTCRLVQAFGIRQIVDSHMLQALSGSIFVPACGEAVGLPGTSAGSMSSNMSSGSMPRGGLLLCACEGWDAKRRLPSLSPTMPPVVLSSDSDGARICRHTPELGAGRAEACLMNVVGSGTA